MPIGKNAIKRVSNNGYSNVQSTSPDMENSEPLEKKQEETAVAQEQKEEIKPEVKKAPAKKSTGVSKKTVKKVILPEIPHIAIGDELPYYLL